MSTSDGQTKPAQLLVPSGFKKIFVSEPITGGVSAIAYYSPTRGLLFFTLMWLETDEEGEPEEVIRGFGPISHRGLEWLLHVVKDVHDAKGKYNYLED